MIFLFALVERMQVNANLRGKVLVCLELSLEFSKAFLCVFNCDLRDQKLNAIGFQFRVIIESSGTALLFG